ncbi:MAG: S8 family serine peptidase [Candidatus Brocadiae bacterium]|nr:S8 family serine peptidase [Candidatus Brocadiia bacterium]
MPRSLRYSVCVLALGVAVFAVASEFRPPAPPMPVEDRPPVKMEGGVIVAVLDTGVDARHPALKDACLPGINVAEAGEPCDDRVGHGTAVAGLIASRDGAPETRGTAPFARILPVKVTPGAERETLPVFLAKGVEKALEAGAHVICIAMAAPKSSGALDAALERARKEGVLVVAAAGVGEEALDFWPAMHPWAISCTVSEPALSDLPGREKQEMLEYPAGRANISGKTEIIGDGFSAVLTPGGGRGQLEGSSVVCARAAGYAARLRERFPKATGAELRQLVTLCGAPMEVANIFWTYPARRLTNAAVDAVPDADAGADLALVDVDLNPGPLEADRAGKIELRVRNIGFRAAAGEVTFRCEPAKIAVSATFEEIPPGGERRVTVDLPPLKEDTYLGAARITSKDDRNAANDALNLRLFVSAPGEGPSLVCSRPRLTRLRGEDRTAVVEFEVKNARDVAFAGHAAVEAGDALSKVPLEFKGRETRTVSLSIELPELEEARKGYALGIGVLEGEKTLASEDLRLIYQDRPVRCQYADAWATKEVVMDAPAFVMEGRSSIPVLIFAPEINTMIDADFQLRAGKVARGDDHRGLWIYDVTLEELDVEAALSATFNPWAEPPATLGGRMLLHVEGLKDKPQHRRDRTVIGHPDLVVETAVGKPMLDVHDLVRFEREDGWHAVINVPLASLRSTSTQTVYLRGMVRYLDQAKNPHNVHWTGFASRDVAYQTMLKVRLHAFLPKLEATGQHYDLHVHTQVEFSRDAVEPRLAWGGPLWMLLRSAHAMGFIDDAYLAAVRSGDLAAVMGREMLFTTDHNTFLTDRDTPAALPFRTGEDEMTTLRRFVGNGASQELSMAPPGGRPLGSPHALTYRHRPLAGPWHGGRKWFDVVLVLKVTLEEMEKLRLNGLVAGALPGIAEILVNVKALRTTLRDAINAELKGTVEVSDEQAYAMAKTLAAFSEEEFGEMLQQAKRILVAAADRSEANPWDVKTVETVLAPAGVYIAAHPVSCGDLSWDFGDLDRAANVTEGTFLAVQEAGRFPFAGVQIWNEPGFLRTALGHPRDLRQHNPWGRDGMLPDSKWHQGWAAGFLHYENRMLRPGLAFTFDGAEPRRKYFIRKIYHYAGSDAHGSFNFTTGVGATMLTHERLMPILALFGHAHGTTTHSSHYGAARVYAQKPSFEEVYRGRVVCTDGPLAWFDVDTDLKFDAQALVWHESWDAPSRAQDVDGEIGGDGVFDGKRTALVRRHCPEMVVRYRIAEGGPTAPQVQRLDLHRLEATDEHAPWHSEGSGRLQVPRPQDSWRPTPIPDRQYRALKPWAPGVPAALWLAGYSNWNDETDDRFGPGFRRCVTNPVWLTTVAIGATAEPVVRDGKAWVPAGKFVATFTADHSMKDAAPTVLLKQFNGEGDSTAGTWRLVPQATPEGIWQSEGREIGGETVVVEDVRMVAVNLEPIPLSTPWYPRDGVVTFAVILSGAQDTHGNPLNAVAAKIEVAAPAGTVITPDPTEPGDPGAGEKPVKTGQGGNRPPDTVTVSVKPGETVELPKGATQDGRRIPAGTWTVPDLPEQGLTLVVSTGGQLLTLVLARAAAPPEAWVERTGTGFYGTAPAPGNGPATVQLKNHATKTVDVADPILVTGDTVVFSAPRTGPGPCDLTVTQGAASKTVAIEAVSPKLSWDRPDARPGEVRTLRLTLEGAADPSLYDVSGTIQLRNGRVVSVADPARIARQGATLTLSALPASTADLATVQAIDAGEMQAEGRLRAVRVPR